MAACLSFACSKPALAIDRDVRSVIVAGGYGILGGTILGLASYPLTRDGRSVFIGSSVGLYLGIIAGIYYVMDRDNPENPLRARELTDLPRLASSPGEASPVPPPLVSFRFAVARF